MNQSGRTSRGFTLLETIAALVILSVAVPAMLWASRDAASKRSDSVLATRARWLAGERLEDIIADRNSPNRGYSYIVSGNYGAESPVAGFAAFSRAVAISETAADLSSAGTGYKRVTVTVSWADGRNQARSFALATVLTDYTP